MNDLFLRACRREPVDRTPVWMMRQAGRYLPQYRAVREKADFITMCKTPELAAEVTIQPVDLIGVDVAILFSDILVIPEAMGMEFQMHEGKGPVFPNPIRTYADALKLQNFDPTDKLKYVLDAISLTKKELNNRVPLIGFAGAPWTLLTYMVEGKSSKTFSLVKKMIYEDPKLAHQILGMLAKSVAKYLKAKVEAGADAIQIFDTWGGNLAWHEFEEFSFRYIKEIIAELKGCGVPIILFAKGVNSNLEGLADSGADVLGLDWTVNLADARKRVGHKVALQGNLDPTVLYAPKEKIRTEVARVLRSYGAGEGHIFNLGHGILPDVNPQNAIEMIKAVKEESRLYHLPTAEM